MVALGTCEAMWSGSRDGNGPIDKCLTEIVVEVAIMVELEVQQKGSL